MNKNSANLQDNFLNQVRKDNILTTIFLINGYQIKGSIKSFDNFTLLLDVDGKQQLVYKHAVSTVIPFKQVFLTSPPAEEDN